ncbi:hypothetical protein E8E12_008346 [Didymella heteroderae]|uniref:C3H1-type domain-containing protein n=1 Tax=Didymella heteroderae TaxID=1769908 RepID=A0A9P4WP11_9PLEO|nr:hypothetical protein E8E12_008346 [Didymella heteroderae]
MATAPFLPGLGHTGTPALASSAVPSPSTTDPEHAAFYQRYELLRQKEKAKTEFISELLTRYEYLSQQYQTLASQSQYNAQGEAAWKAEKPVYERYLQQYQRALSENPFVMVLIDGDGMVFLNENIRDGEAGGRLAASQLDIAVRNWIESEAKEVPLSSRIICRVYANVRGLGDVLVRTGAIGAIEDFENFVRGFTRAKTLFDFIDVGAGKDRADEKIIENFKIFSQDYHCRKLLFGCSHDNGYARILEECSDKSEIVSKVVLLEGVPFEKELLPLPPGPVVNSWAAKAAAPPLPVSALPAYEPADRNKVIARNRAGQRIDPPTKDYDKAEVDRIKKLKLCNVHFLRQECPYDMQCAHKHTYQPDRSEIATLRLVARMSPCSIGSACQDYKCIFGHRCPAPPSTKKVPKGTKSCIFAETCKFPLELHDIDSNVVKTLVV